MNKYRDTKIVSVEVKTITPAMASEMLNKNNGNRNISQAKVQYYARIMREGSWKLTHQGIAISTTGNIIDGQHRLVAIVQYGKPIDFIVTIVEADDGLGELTAVGQPIDIGKIRSISDITSEHRRYVMIVRGLIRDFVPNGSVRAQDPEVVGSAVDIVRNTLEEISAKCGSTKKGLSNATIQGVMLIRQYRGIEVLTKYRDALNGRLERLPKSWVSWHGRITEIAEHKNLPKNGDFRKYVAATTWQVTDPDKNEDQMVLVKNLDRYNEMIQDEVQSIFIKALTKSPVNTKMYKS